MFARALEVAAVIGVLAICRAEAISKISVTGSKFFTESGDQFYVKGMELLF